MKPKEQAVKIVNDMRLFYGEYLDADGEPKNHYKVNKTDARQCAIVAVNLILNDTNVNGDERNFWIAVKQELEKLNLR